MENNKEDYKIYNENHMENCNVFQGDQYGGVFPLPGAQVTINQQFGKGQKPKQEVTEGKVETAEERDKRKAEVMKAITDKFDFADENLGYDNNRKKITNDRLGILFRKCFGIGSYPSAVNRAIMEQMWVLLIDERERCAKLPSEGFFRQTVLNVIGYFVKKELIFGTQKVVAQGVFKDVSEGMTKHIPRVFSNCPDFPDGLEDMLDFYIDKLMDGEF